MFSELESSAAGRRETPSLQPLKATKTFAGSFPSPTTSQEEPGLHSATNSAFLQSKENAARLRSAYSLDNISSITNRTTSSMDVHSSEMNGVEQDEVFWDPQHNKRTYKTMDPVSMSTDLEGGPLSPRSTGSASSYGSRRSSTSDFRSLQELGRIGHAPPLQTTGRRTSVVQTLERERQNNPSRLRGLSIPSRKPSSTSGKDTTVVADLPTISKSANTTLPKPERRFSYQPLMPVTMGSRGKLNGSSEQLSTNDFKFRKRPVSANMEFQSLPVTTKDAFKGFPPRQEAKKDIRVTANAGGPSQSNLPETSKQTESTFKDTEYPPSAPPSVPPGSGSNWDQSDSSTTTSVSKTSYTLSFSEPTARLVDGEMDEDHPAPAPPSSAPPPVPQPLDAITEECHSPSSQPSRNTLQHTTGVATTQPEIQLNTRSNLTNLEVDTKQEIFQSGVSPMMSPVSPGAKSPHKTPPPVPPKPRKPVSSPTPPVSSPSSFQTSFAWDRKSSSDSSNAQDFNASSPLLSPNVDKSQTYAYQTKPEEVTTLIASFSPAGVEQTSFTFDTLEQAAAPLEKTSSKTVEESESTPEVPPLPNAAPPSLPSVAPPSVPSPYDDNVAETQEEQWSIAVNVSSTISEDSALVDNETDSKIIDSTFDSADELESALKSDKPERSSGLVLNKTTINVSREDISEGRGSLLSSPDVILPLSPTPSDADSGIYSSKADHQRSDSGQSGRCTIMLLYRFVLF